MYIEGLYVGDKIPGWKYSKGKDKSNDKDFGVTNIIDLIENDCLVDSLPDD